MTSFPHLTRAYCAANCTKRYYHFHSPHALIPFYLLHSQFSGIRLFAGMSSRRIRSAPFGVRAQPFMSRAKPLVYEELPQEIPVDEEKIPGYNSKYFYPANPGDILENRYQLDVKVGWGSSSTVWLAHDIQRYSIFLLSVQALNCKFSHEEGCCVLMTSQRRLAQAKEVCGPQDLQLRYSGRGYDTRVRS